MEDDVLKVWFHFGGLFENDETGQDYVGGREAVSLIVKNKMSFPELVGHLRDHYPE